MCFAHVCTPEGYGPIQISSVSSPQLIQYIRVSPSGSFDTSLYSYSIPRFPLISPFINGLFGGVLVAFIVVKCYTGPLVDRL